MKLCDRCYRHSKLVTEYRLNLEICGMYYNTDADLLFFYNFLSLK